MTIFTFRRAVPAGLARSKALALCWLVLAWPAAGAAADGPVVAVVRSKQAEAHVAAAWGDAYAREAELWVREATRVGVAVREVSDLELAEGRTTYDALVVPFPDFDDARSVFRFQALVEQARRVLLVGAPLRSRAAAVERLRVTCGAPEFVLQTEPTPRTVVLAGRSFLAAEVPPGVAWEVQGGGPVFQARSPEPLAWFSDSGAPQDGERGVGGGAALVGFTCGGAEVVWSGVPFSALVGAGPQAAPGPRAAQVAVLVANVVSWLAGRPWLGRAPWRDDRSFAVTVVADLEVPVTARALFGVLEDARVRGSFLAPSVSAAGQADLPVPERAGVVVGGVTFDQIATWSGTVVADDCEVLRTAGEGPTAAVVPTLLGALAARERAGGLYALRLRGACLLDPARISAVALFLAAAKGHPAWFATLDEVVDWRRARDAVVVRPVPGGFRVRNTADTALVGFPLVSYRFGPDDLARLGQRGLILPRDDGGATFVIDLGPGEEVFFPVARP